MTADACGCEVVSGPAEASTLGNIMLQAVATGHLADVGSGRTAIAESVQCSVFTPRRGAPWDEAYARFCALAKNRIDRHGAFEKPLESLAVSQRPSEV